MPMHLNQTIATSRLGINYVCSLIARQKCTFQEIEQHNDVGNDAYIEFFSDRLATGCCIAAQIKTGDRYINRSTDDYFIIADRNHFEYWHSHILPVAGIVYDPTTDQARWVDITAHLRNNPQLIEAGPFTIHITRDHVLDDRTFRGFQEHFVGYSSSFSQVDKFGIALDLFAKLDDDDACYNGFRSLFSYHRQRLASWYYLISCFRNFQGHSLLRDIIVTLSYIPGHPDIFWHRGNNIDEQVRLEAKEFLASRFDRNDVLLLLESIDDYGIARGTVGQCVDAIIGIVNKHNEILESIVFDQKVIEEIRFAALLLLLSYIRPKTKIGYQQLIHRYLETYPDSDNKEILQMIIDNIKQEGGFSLYT
ncbi:MAG: DUF4365 domain-containing protein [Armatimonadota bacterium]